MTRPYPMDHVDTAFFSVDTDAMPQTIAAVCLLDRPPDWQNVESRVASALQQFPRLQEKVVRQPQLAWQEDANFDLENHLAVIHSPKIKDQLELMAEAGKIVSRPLDMALPPWRLVLITGDDNLACVVLCLHHGSADGVRAMRLLEAISSDSPTRSSGSPLPPEGLSPPTSRGWLSGLGHGLKCSRKLIAEGLIPCGASPLNGDTSCQRSITPVDLSRRELARVMRQVDGSLHDVLYTIVAGAIRIYHERCGAANNDLRVVVPMAVPPRSYKGGLGNHLVLSTLTLSVSESDPLKRLVRVREMFSRMKTDGTIGAYEFAAAAIHRFVPRALHRKVWDTMLRKTNLVCTILPGPFHARYLGGARIEGIYGVPAPVVGHGAAFAFVSYAGKICGSIVTDKNVISAPTELADSLKTSLRQLGPDINDDSITHPLLGRALSLPGDDSLFEGSIQTAARPYLGEYSLYDATLAPTGTLLEILLAATTTTLNESECGPNHEAQSARSFASPLRLEEVVLGQPLCLSTQHDRTIQTTVIRKDSSRSVQVSSLADDESWIGHATATICLSDEPQPPLDLAIDQLRRHCPHPVPIAEFYRECSERHVDYRAGLQGLRELWRGEGEALGLAEMAECLTDAGDYHFHPALLEACLQVAMTGSSNSTNGRAMQFDGVKRIDVYGCPGTRVWSHATFGNDGHIISADVELFTPEGRCIARLEGLRLTATSRESLFSDRGIEESFDDKVRDADSAQRRQLVLSHVRQQVADVLGWSAAERIRLRDRLFELGIDSMMAIDLHRRLQTTMRLTLPEMLVFDYPTVEALTDYLLGQIGDTSRHATAAAERVEELGALSENELADLLQKELDS